MLGYDFEIPCPHRADKTLWDETLPIEMRAKKHSLMPELPDYHPLTKEEVARFLDETVEAEKADGDIGKIIAIAIRLTKGVVGMTCPRPIFGEVHDRWQQVLNLHREVIKHGSNPTIVEQMYKIMIG
jgi:hypothetical protein